ncbi:Schizosaccharomyces specific protein [Schizosaccharomyces osmophilus]|uniref:Schizosaccharomyces specific protein n=1 Tax=Schizosaccharomyces osmophilus TaxID=2545709 RepID=A0AAF0AV44_9SCHI|nr:Schizosaccharomyces specific protein [Schizosaccharomyces osmophilus]WBW71554.1 Schizosaccharomyces specific protein [Schizosaccharomyces osmophilus]
MSVNSSQTDSNTVQVDEQAKTWIQGKVEEELKRLESIGAKAVPLTVKNYSVILDENTDTVMNRIELKTSFDFNHVQQILLSPAQPYPHDSNLKFLYLVILTNLPHPMLIPYLFTPKVVGKNLLPRADGLVENTLKRWIFINEKLQRADHVVREYQDVE